MCCLWTQMICLAGLGKFTQHSAPGNQHLCCKRPELHFHSVSVHLLLFKVRMVWVVRLVYVWAWNRIE